MSDLLELCTSREMQSVRDLTAKVAKTDVTVLLRGESGVGEGDCRPGDSRRVATGLEAPVEGQLRSKRREREPHRGLREPLA